MKFPWQWKKGDSFFNLQLKVRRFDEMYNGTQQWFHNSRSYVIHNKNNTKLTDHIYFNRCKIIIKSSSDTNGFYSSLNSDDFIYAVSIFYHICLQPLRPCKQPWYLDIYSF